jgi:3-methyladenine DNA glycosylase AlkD
MNPAALVAEIESCIAALPERSTQTLRALRREYSKRIRAWPPGDVIETANELIAHGRIHRFFADELIANHAGAMAGLDRKSLERLGGGMSSWDQVDCFACYLSGPAWREGRIDDGTVAGWAAKKDHWWRRAALVSTVPLNVRARGGQGDVRRTLRVCGLLIDDRDDMVVKALSWALRTLAQRDPHAVSQFLNANEERLPALVRREVRNKLTTGRKSVKSTGRK